MTAYDQLLAELREIAALASAQALLAWDQETMMPPAAAAGRAEQLALLAGLIHQRRTCERFAELLAACEADPELAQDDEATANLRELRRDHERLTRLPSTLVREFSETTSLALEAWKDARERSDFAAFAPWLQKVRDLTRAKAECYGAPAGGTLYDALLDEYEPGARSAELERVFSELRARLVPLIARVMDAPNPPADVLAGLRVPVAAQEALGRRVLSAIGFDLNAGRLDVSTHPFCEGLAPGDTRLTTRYREDAAFDALSSTLHEMGHGLYEQGLPKAERRGQPLAEAASLGIHESQSRLWENLVGRSHAFWEWALPIAQQVCGASLAHLTPGAVYRAVNRVQPNLIRVDSDEATYNLHVMLRFDLERALLAGELPVAELPGAWSERVGADLGLAVPDDRRGALQDIHWAMGAVGYFPTYTLGNLYAAQLWEAVARALPDVQAQLRAGEFAPLLGWLRENVHRHGRRYPAAELCRRATGEPLSPEPLLRYLEAKLTAVYAL